MKEAWNVVVDLCVNYGGKLLLAVIVLIIGMSVIKKIVGLVDQSLKKRVTDKTLHSVVKNVVNALLYVLLIISVVEILGVPMTSVLALFASCGLAIGLALQGALTNFAGGLMILIFKPFKVGDYVECSGGQGVVTDITIFYTVIVNLDNIRISVPNGDLMNSSVSNYNSEKTRRINLDFKITNDIDQDMVREVLLAAASKTKDILPDPEPFARLSAVDDDTYIFTVRVWTVAEKYWDVYFDTLENCTKALAANGIDDPEERIAVRLVDKED